MIAIHKSSFTDVTSDKMPRIQDKLLLVIDPDCPVEFQASQISGILNNLINTSSKPIFNSFTAITINQFLEQQSGKICLVAHNGFSYFVNNSSTTYETFP